MTLLSSYTDKSGLFTLEVGEEDDGDDNEGEVPGPDHSKELFPPSTEWPQTKMEVEEEDELLYGDIDALTNREKWVQRCDIPFLILFPGHVLLLQVQCLQVDSNVRNLRKIPYHAVCRSVYFLCLVGLSSAVFYYIMSVNQWSSNSVKCGQICFIWRH